MCAVDTPVMWPYSEARPEIEPLPEWQELLEELIASDGRRTIYLLGRTDTGKTTLCCYLLHGLRDRRRCALIDGDTGQSTVGPPTTLGLALCGGEVTGYGAVRLRFAGSTSPRGHFLPFLTGARRLLDEAVALGAETVLIDSPGYVGEEAALEFQVHMIDLLMPQELVAIAPDGELELILTCFRGESAIHIHRLPLPPRARRRTQAERQRWRESAFRCYFRAASEQEISLEGRGVHGRLPASFRSEDWRGLIVALCDGMHFVLALAIVEELDIERWLLRVRAPEFDRKRVSVIQVGSIRLDAERVFAGEGWA
ncbi:MAG: Clp1/GlmU family protein [Methanomicrobiales archaeon]|nr:Clp1/GlmU family protein [Methanomicrobiales archaeon]